MKIAIVGHVGSGKSTLAGHISQKLGIPHIHIDRFWLESGGSAEVRYSPGWQQKRLSVRDKFEETVKNHDRWVSDGWLKVAAPSADQIVFLDIPLWRRLYGLARRIFSMRRHPEVSRWDDVLFVFDAIPRFFRTDSALRTALEKHKSKLIILYTYKEVGQYLQNLH